MSESLIEELRRDFEGNDEAPYIYAEAFVNAHIAAQIKTIREQRELSQEELAKEIGTKQSGISRLQNANYSGWKVETLRKLARAFGLWLDIDFKEFGDLPKRVEGFRENMLRRTPFGSDPAFHPELQQPQRSRHGRGRKVRALFLVRPGARKKRHKNRKPIDREYSAVAPIQAAASGGSLGLE